MKYTVWEKRIPTIPAIVVIFASIWVTLYLVQSGVFTVSNASPDTEPTHVLTGNITDTSFTVAFSTRSQAIAGIKVTHPDGGEQVLYDIREQGAVGTTPFFSHYFQTQDLQANTTYHVTLLVNGQEYRNGTDPYSVTTGPPLDGEATNSKSLSGTILLPDGSPAEDTIIVTNIADGQTLLTTTQANGTFLIPLNTLRVGALSEYKTVGDSDTVSLEAFRESLQSKVSLQITQSGALPPITLSQNYSTFQTQPDQPIDIQTQLEIPVPQTVSSTIAISSPQHNETFIDTRPTFRGTALPNKPVELTIRTHSPIEAEVLSDRSGRWSYRPTTALPAGTHSLVIQSSDNFSILRSVTRSFTILPIGSQVSESATPSATPTSTVAPTPVVTLSPTPTTVVTIPPTLTPTPTDIPTPTPILTITPTPPGSTTTVVVTLLSVLFIIVGTTLLFVVG